MPPNASQGTIHEWLADLAGGGLEGAELRSLLSTRIGAAEEVERAAREVEVTRRIRALMMRLGEAEVDVPPGFEARLMERVLADETLLDLLEVYLSGFGRALVEFINLLLDLLPQGTQPAFAAGR